MQGEDIKRGVRLRRRFHFKACWTNENKCKTLIDKSWGDNTGVCSMVDIVGKIRGCTKQLSVLNTKNIIFEREIRDLWFGLGGIQEGEGFVELGFGLGGIREIQERGFGSVVVVNGDGGGGSVFVGS
ncbi:hypothetical protein Q3G72_019107 [Acer saccharum]|nr:hypothetical protein Q3G72_019107 [Acer saccharum]